MLSGRHLNQATPKEANGFSYDPASC
jgi:hypothetical protein